MAFTHTAFIQIGIPSPIEASPCFVMWEIYKVLGMMLKINILTH